MVCPYNEFKGCYKEECPFYLKVLGKNGYIEYCEKAEKEKEKRVN